MSDPAIGAAVFAARHLAQNHLAYQVARLRRELGLLEVAGVPIIRDRTVTAGRTIVRPTFARDARGRFVRAGR